MGAKLRTDVLPDLLTPASEDGRWAQLGGYYAAAAIIAAAYWLLRYRALHGTSGGVTWHRNPAVMTALLPSIGAILFAVGALERDWAYAVMGLPLLAGGTVHQIREVAYRSRGPRDDGSGEGSPPTNS